MKTTKEFTLFWNGPFSSWHKAPILIDGNTFNCCEQYFMFKKALAFNDTDIALKVWRSEDPREQKRLGREIRYFTSQVWDNISRDIMFRAHLAKYRQHSHLLELLLKTGDSTIAEASPFDKIWGIGLGENDPRALDQTKWLGKNRLGIILMDIRSCLK